MSDASPKTASGRISIIGGAGRVGSTAAYALQTARLGDEIVLVDAAVDAAKGEALDLTHGRAAVGGPRISAGGYDAVAGSDIVVVTAGLRRKPDESRLRLLERNAALFREIVASVKAVKLAPEAVLLVVTNPVDVLTYLAATELGWPSRQTIGLGTVLDSLRFRSLLGQALGVDPSLIDGMMLGEHGDSMVPIVSGLRWNGKPMADLPNYSDELVRKAADATRRAGAECLRLKGGAGYAVGLAVREVVAAILGDTGAVLPVSTVHDSGELKGVALSVPTRVGRRGWSAHEPLSLSEEEHRGLLRSADVLRETIALLQSGAGGAA
ncbi:MAG: malate dehydrogenase [Armatimonadota bacterium]